MPDPRYPIGKFQIDPQVTPEKRRAWIEAIAACPENLRAAVNGLGERELDTPYRPGGWTVRQVVHHVPDSHLNAYCRVKLALTEDEPTIKTYREERWAELPDSKSDIENSLALLAFLHQRWVLLLRAIAHEDWKRTLQHPEMGVMTLETLVSLYAWHSRHHVAHITSLRARLLSGPISATGA
jgi:hypothetical protein